MFAKQPRPEALRKQAEDRAIKAAVDAVNGAALQQAAKGGPGAAMGAGMMRQPGTSWSNQGGMTNNSLVARLTQNLAANFRRPPEEVEQAMARQGLSWGPPFAPGRPLDPFWGYRRPAKTWDYPVGVNTQISPRSGRISFTTLKSLWDSYDIAQICTQHLINDVRSLDYHYEAALGIREDVSDDVRKAREFMDYPDRRQPFRAWVAEYLMDVIRFDAGALYIRRTNAGDPYALEVISGPTIAPNIDYFGRVAADDDPDGKNLTPDGVVVGDVVPAFVQVIEGMPFNWLAHDDLIYQALNPQPDSQYGRAPLEAVMLTANTDIRFQWHFLNYFTAGNIPQGFMEAPPDLSDPNQIAEWQEKWDAWMAGDQDMLRRIRFIPAGSKYTPVGPASEKFDAEFPLYLMRRVCAAHGVTPNDLGFTDTVNKATSETQVDVQFRVGTLPLVRHVEDVVNLFLQEHLKLRVRLRFDTGREIEDRLATAQAETLYVKAGVLSADEPRARLGYPVSLTRPTPRFIDNTRNGPIPLISLESLAGKIDVETFAPVKDAPLVDHPFMPLPGVVAAVGSQAGSLAENASAAMQANMIASNIGAAPPYPDNETTSPPPHNPAAVKGAKPLAAGIAVVAKDTGRVLMIQRSNADPGKKAAGRWEMPGGRLEDSEDAWAAAQREWEEETGNKLPKGDVFDTWDDDKGPYRLFIYTIRAEDDLLLNPDRESMEVVDPDHPNAQQTEVTAWWEPDNAADMGRALRKELRKFDWDIIKKAAAEARKGAATAGMMASTGMQGHDLIRGSGLAHDDDDDDEEAAKEALDVTLRRWRENARNRLRKGLEPRRFLDSDIPQDLADSIWQDLSKASTRDDIDRAFLGKADARSTKPGEFEQKVRSALGMVVGGGVIAAAVHAAFTAPRKQTQAVDQQYRKARAAALATLLGQRVTGDALATALRNYWTQAGSTAASNAAALVTLPDAPVHHRSLDKLIEAAPPIADGLAYGLLYEVADQAATQALAENVDEATATARIAASMAKRAARTAAYEAHRATIAAQLDVYRHAGVQKLLWVGGTCARCRANAAASPIDARGEWPNGPPPVHSSCRCTLVPA